MKTILFICTGNICRSPMAEGLFRQAAGGRGDFRVLSAGIGAVNDQPPTPHAVAAMRELGIDISGAPQPDADGGPGAAGGLHFWHDAQPRGHDCAVVSAGGGKDLFAARI